MKIFFTFIILITSTLSFSQRDNYQLKNSLPLITNSANTGLSKSARINYGASFFAYDNTISIVNFASYDQHVSKLHGGVGIQVSNWNFHSFKKNRIKISYAFQHSFTEKISISAGAAIGLTQSRIKDISTTEYLHYAPNFNFGSIIYGENFFFGINVNKESEIYANSNMPEKRTYNTNLLINTGYRLTPFQNKENNFVLAASYSNQDGFINAQFSVAFNSTRFSVGTSYSILNQNTYFAGIKFWQMQLKAAYTLSHSLLTNSSSNTTELILQYNFKKELLRKSKAFNIELF